MGCKHKECVSCANADGTITYSQWWYCKNPKDFREFEACREGTPQPEWCPKTLPKKLLELKEMIEEGDSACLRELEWRDLADIAKGWEKSHEE